MHSKSASGSAEPVECQRWAGKRKMCATHLPRSRRSYLYYSLQVGSPPPTRRRFCTQSHGPPASRCTPTPRLPHLLHPPLLAAIFRCSSRTMQLRAMCLTATTRAHVQFLYGQSGSRCAVRTCHRHMCTSVLFYPLSMLSTAVFWDSRRRARRGLHVLQRGW